MSKEKACGSWLIDLIMKFKPDLDPTDVEEFPDSLIVDASWKAFAVSTIASVPPGPVGVLTILPEVVAVTRIQVILIYKIANFYGKTAQLDSTIVALILGNAAGIAAGRVLTKSPEGKIIIKRMASLALRNFTSRLGAKIMGRIIARLPSRWIPLLLVPVFGVLSKTATTRIGWEAVSLFSKDFEFEQEEKPQS